jgi:hypothetical protein
VSEFEAAPGIAFAIDYCPAGLAAMPERPALASIGWTANRATIRDVIHPADDVILEAIQQACKTGIDCPIG